MPKPRYLIRKVTIFPGGCKVLLTLILCFSSHSVLAQGQDSTTAQRNLLVIAEMLPGQYNNANQHYFDKRRGLDEEDRHVRIHTEIRRIEAPAFGTHVFLWTNASPTEEGEQRSWRIASLTSGTEDAADDEVVMRHHFGSGEQPEATALKQLTPDQLRRTSGCDYYFKRRASSFRGSQRPQACQFEWDGEMVYTDNTIELSATDLWFHDHKYVIETGQRITGVASGEPYWLERARIFHCYADIPGVGGGRDIPFERYDGITLHDKGDSHWFVTQDEEKRNLGLSLQSVTWHVLNENNGNFNRNSLVLYVMERLDDGSIAEHGYTFTTPEADRLGVNLKWMLVNCSITPRDQARPEM